MRRPKVEIYHSALCGLCHEAMDYFAARGIPFEAYEVRWKGAELVDSEAARELTRRVGPVDFVPQIFIDGQHIPGWRTLSRLIATGAIDALLRGEDGAAERPAAREGNS